MFNSAPNLGFIIHGGAAPALNKEPTFKQRELINAPQYEIIAKAAAHYIQNGEVLIIASSVTTLQVAIRLAADKKDLTVFTDSSIIASALSSNPTFKVHLAPGLYNGDENCVYGAETINYFNNIFENKVILGATGLNQDGISNADIDVAETYKVMAKQSTQKIVVADCSKISRNALSLFLPWTEVDRLIIDNPPYDEELMVGLKHGAVQVTIASESSWNF